MKGHHMKIKLLVSRAGPMGAQNAGDEIEVADAEAVRMIEAGQAEAVRSVAPEKAVSKRKAEKAVRG